MAQMYAALEDMGVDTSDDPYRDSFDPACTTLGAHPGMPAAQRGSEDRLPPGCDGGSRLAADRAFAMLPIGGWAAGPVDTRGRFNPVSDRPLLCMSVHNDLAVVGSADHGLIEVCALPFTLLCAWVVWVWAWVCGFGCGSGCALPRSSMLPL